MRNSRQTTFDLNGPILSFATQPVGVASTGVVSGTGSGIATFIGIATATFTTGVSTGSPTAPSNPASNTGIITYRWYEVGVGALSDSTYVTGTATTTLTLSRLITPTDNQRRFYLEADYIPSAYQTSSPVTAGTARSTGNAINEPLSSSVGILTVFPLIEIIAQPSNATSIISENATFNVNAGLTDSFFADDLIYQWHYNGSPLTDGTVAVGINTNITMSGSRTASLSIRADNVVGLATVFCKITSTTAINSPLSSNIVEFKVISSATRSLVNLEQIGSTNTASLSTVDLQSGEYTINQPAASANISQIIFYALDRDINIEMDLYGGRGTINGSNSGGEGGFSRIRFTMTRNTEYVIAGLTNIINTPFIYRKGQLIACVGKGGNAGTSGRGGFGGGIGIAGNAGFGRDAGAGGSLVAAGSLGGNGIFGSLTSLVPTAPDTKATDPDGGRALKCTKGVYWRDQGVSACADVGTGKFRLSGGAEVTNTASIARGYKAGYDIIQTAGRGSSNGGAGGHGAAGGAGGVNGSGGGGGSGYTDGSVTVVNTQLGGNTGEARVVIRIVS